MSSYMRDSFLALAGPYALEVESGSQRLEGDAAQTVVGGRRGSGLGRYCNDGGRKRTNTRFSAKEGTARTWGVRAVGMIHKGDEIFTSYGDLYWKSRRDSE